MSTILITGVSRGCGRAIADEFSRLGHTILGCARSDEAISELSRKYPSPHAFQTLDITDDAAVRSWADSLRSIPIDLILNNAALINKPAPLWEVEADEFDRIVDVNIKGTANILRHFLPLLIQRGTGVVINFSSGWGRSTSAEVAPYCTTKWAIEGMTAALAQELPPGVGTFALNPGIINTDMLREAFGAGSDQYPSPEKWASTAAPFLLSLKPGKSDVQISAP